MRFNRKAAQRAIDLAVARDDMRVIPFGLAFVYIDEDGRPTIGVRQPFSTAMRVSNSGNHWTDNDDPNSVRFNTAATSTSWKRNQYVLSWELRPALKPRSLKKHELRKQARELRRMKQYD